LSRKLRFVALGLLSLGFAGTAALAATNPPRGGGGGGYGYGYAPTCKPGNGFGDKNHCHSGPPGQVDKHDKHAPKGNPFAGIPAVVTTTSTSTGSGPGNQKHHPAAPASDLGPHGHESSTTSSSSTTTSSSAPKQHGNSTNSSGTSHNGRGHH